MIVGLCAQERVHKLQPATVADKMVSVAEPMLFARFGEQALGEVEPFLSFRQLLLQDLDTLFKSLETRSYFRRCCHWTRGDDAGDFDGRHGNYCDHRYECANYARVHGNGPWEG